MKSTSLLLTLVTLASCMTPLSWSNALAQPAAATNPPPSVVESATTSQPWVNARGGTNGPGAPLGRGRRGGARGRGVIPVAQDPADFYFPGGTPREFLQAIEKHYSVDWLSVTDIPNEMQFVHIPVLRMSPESAAALLAAQRGFGGRGGGGRQAGGANGGGGFGNFGGGAVYVVSGADSAETGAPGAGGAERNPLEAVVNLYNSLQSAKPELGQLIVEGAFAKPSVVLFRVPSSAASQSYEPSAQVYPLRGIPEGEWTKLSDSIQQAGQEQADNFRSGNPFSVSIHRDTALLIVYGPKRFVALAESMMKAWQMNQVYGIEPASPLK